MSFECHTDPFISTKWPSDVSCVVKDINSKIITVNSDEDICGEACVTQVTALIGWRTIQLFFCFSTLVEELVDREISFSQFSSDL